MVRVWSSLVGTSEPVNQGSFFVARRPRNELIRMSRKVPALLVSLMAWLGLLGGTKWCPQMDLGYHYRVTTTYSCDMTIDGWVTV